MFFRQQGRVNLGGRLRLEITTRALYVELMIARDQQIVSVTRE